MQMSSQLKNESKSLLIIAILVAAGTMIVTTFINVFFIRATQGNMGLIILQNMIGFITMWFAYVVGARLLSKVSMANLLRVGIASLFLYLLIIVLFQNHLDRILIPIAVFNGLGMGLYWFMINLFIVQVVKEEEQGRYFGYQQTAASILGVLTPVISGFIITRFVDLTGYYVLFGIAWIFYLLAIFMTRRLPNEKTMSRVRIFEVLKVKKNRYFNAGKLFRFVVSLRETVNVQIFMLFAFLILRNEGIMGTLFSATAMIATISSFWFAKKHMRQNQQYFYLIVVLGMSSIYLLLAVVPSVVSLVIASSIFALLNSWSITISSSVFFQLVSRAKGGFEAGEYVAALELSSIMGRLVGLLLALAMTHFMASNMLVYRVLFVVIAIAWLLEYFIIEKQVKWFRGESC